MRMPIFVPLLIMVAAAGLFAFDVVSVVNASHDPVAYHVTHADDNQTFVAAVLTPLDPGEDIRSPDAGGWVVVVHRTVADDITVVTSTNGSHDAPTLSNRSFVALTLHEKGEYLIIPAWQIDALAAGQDVDILHHATSLDGLRFDPGHVSHPGDGDVHGWPGSVALVWRLQNDTDEYTVASQEMQERGPGAMPELYAVESHVVARDPWFRATAVAMATVAVGLAVVPRLRPERGGLAPAPAGANVELAATGRRFLESIRNAYLALAGSVALLGIPLMVFVMMFAKSATGPAGHLEFIGAGDPWEGTVWRQMLFIVLAGVVVAARPGLDAHLAVRRWRRVEAAPPIEGELGR